jgi:Kip1 ubiquitination-promoting complex protein 1
VYQCIDDCVLECRYRVTMFARWKLRGMYATCMWLVQLLLVLSKKDPLFSFVPEFYVETLVSVYSSGYVCVGVFFHVC